jgi:hypothetical protein
MKPIWPNAYVTIEGLPAGVTVDGSNLRIPLSRMTAFRAWLASTTAGIGPAPRKKRAAHHPVVKVKRRTWSKAQRTKFTATRAAKVAARIAASQAPDPVQAIA